MKKFKGYLAFLKRVLFQLKTPANWRYSYLMLYGFTPNKGVLYDFEKHKRGEYLTDVWRYVDTQNINAKYFSLFNDKLNSYYFFKNFTDRVVPVLGIIDNGRYIIIEKQPDEQELPVILKDKNGWGGFGVTKALLRGNTLYDNHGSLLHIGRYSNYIAVPLLENESYAKKIFPNTLNTIRILSGVIDDEVVNIRAIHRFGNVTTGNVDNFSSGGMSCNVDIQSGIIDSVIYIQNGKKYNIENHPDTKEKIKGIAIPGWQGILDFVNEIHSKIKYVKYIGWDIVICNDGVYIVEANHISDIDLIQTHYPLLSDKTVAHFFKQQFRETT